MSATVEYTLRHPIEVDGRELRTLTLRAPTEEERRGIRRTRFTTQKRGAAICRAATGLSLRDIARIEQIDYNGMAAALLALDPDALTIIRRG